MSSYELHLDLQVKFAPKSPEFIGIINILQIAILLPEETYR